MTKNVADNLGRHARVDLSSGMAVAEHMGAKRKDCHPRTPCVFANLMAKHTGREWSMR
jgi:hypothetical protein